VQNGTHFYGYDGNGNVSALVNASNGEVTANYEYGPYGEPIRVSGVMSKENPYRFSTKRAVDSIDIILYEYRHYKPSTGTWLTRDPIGEKGGKNLYSYGVNDAINSFDFVGLCVGSCDSSLGVSSLSLKNQISDIHRGFCTWLERKIRGFLNSQEEIRAWDRFTSGTGIDIELTDFEIGSVLESAHTFKNEINKQSIDCKTKSFYWFNSTIQISDSIGYPWSAALGRIFIKLTTSCSCRTLTWKACIFDKYDFDPTWFLGGKEPIAEIKTILVWAAQNIGQCGWKEFYHKGCKNGFIAN